MDTLCIIVIVLKKINKICDFPTKPDLNKAKPATN